MNDSLTLFPEPESEVQEDKVQLVWDGYVEEFGDTLRVRDLTPPRRRMIEKGLAAVNDDADVLLSAFRGLKRYRQRKPGKTSIDAVLRTFPGGSNLTEQIEFWASHDAGLQRYAHTPEMEALIERRKADVAGMLPATGTTVERMLAWLRSNAGEEPVIEDGTFKGWRPVTKLEFRS